MLRISLKTFKTIINSRYREQSNNIQNILIEIGNDLYSKAETLNILKAINPSINPLKVKKIVSLNHDQKLTIDSGLSTNVFVFDEELTEEEKNLFKKDQLLFVEDDNDNTKIKIYKISFNESNEGENFPELAQLKDMTLKTFNDLFINSGLLRNENVFNQLLQTPTNFQNQKLVKSYWRGNSYGNNKAAIVNQLKTNLLANNNNIEDDYFICYKDGKVIMTNVNNSNYQTELKIPFNNNYQKNDIFYFCKINGKEHWQTYKINQKNFLSTIEYHGYQLQDLTATEFNDLKALSNLSQPGFTITTNNNGLASFFAKEQENIGAYALSYCQKITQEVVREREVENWPTPLTIDNDINANIKALLVNKSQHGLYSLAIDDNKLRIVNIQTEVENVVFEQTLSSQNKTAWTNLFNNNKYQKVYFAKDVNSNLVEKWVFNSDQQQLQCVQRVYLADLRKHFANNNLFYVPELISTEGIYLGENSAAIAATTSQSNITITPPPVIYNVINLKWNNNVKLWNLNVTTRENTLDTKFIFTDQQNKILQKLITTNNNANTVILFNKYDGKFLRAYYIDENNKKVSCSSILTDEEKEQLSDINNKAKTRIENPIIAIPINLSSDNKKTFNLSYFNNKWHVLCKEEYEKDKQIKAEIQLTNEEINQLLALVNFAIDIAITFDGKDNFNKIENKNFSGKNKSKVITSNCLSDNHNQLLQKVLTTIADQKKLKPENSNKHLKPWNANTVTSANNISSSAVTTNGSPPQQQL